MYVYVCLYIAILDRAILAEAHSLCLKTSQSRKARASRSYFAERSFFSLLGCGAMASIEEIGRLFDTKASTIVKEINGRLEKNEARTEDAYAKIYGVHDRLKQVELKVAGLSGSASSKFIPKQVINSNFCKWEE